MVAIAAEVGSRHHENGDSWQKMKSGLINLGLGAGIQCAEAASLGMPFEVWKTRMARYRNENTVQAFVNVYKYGGGAQAFWKGLGPKLVESASKGAVLMLGKESANDSLLKLGVEPTTAGLAAGAFGGLTQTVVISPMTYLVTGAVTGDQSITTMQRVRQTFQRNGIAGFYKGGSAVAFRQMTNWAMRQGFTEGVRVQFKLYFHGNKDAKLTKTQEIGAGVIGGALSVINQPFEVARVEMQARADQGQKGLSMPQVLRMVYQDYGIAGLYKGVVPRIGLGVYQTLFMVTFAKIIKDELQERKIIN